MRLFHNSSASFQPFESADSKSASKGEELREKIPAPSEFSLNSGFFESLLKDPLFKSEFDRKVEEAALKIAREQFEPFKEKVVSEAKAEGMTKGKEESISLIEAHSARLSEVATKLLEDKELLLHQHEAHWMRALGHLLDRFLISERKDLLSAIERWLSSALDSFAKKETLRIFLAPSEFEPMAANIAEIEKRGWVMEKDPTLAPGEIRCEAAGAGMFFSPHAERQKLDEILERFYPTKEKETNDRTLSPTD